MRVAWIAILAGCDAGLPPPAPPGPRPTPITDGSGGWYALVEPAAVAQECSNLGGEHITLRIVDATPAMPTAFHLGGHGSYATVPCHARFIAHVVWSPRHDIADSGWCLGGLPTYDGTILAIAPLAPDADPIAQLSRAARSTMPDMAPPMLLAAIAGKPPPFETGSGHQCF